MAKKPFPPPASQSAAPASQSAAPASQSAAPAKPPAPSKTSVGYTLDHALGAIAVHVEPEFDTNTLLITIRSPATGVALHLSPQDAGAIGGVLVNWALNHGYRAP